MIIEIIIAVIGFLMCFLLFGRLRFLPPPQAAAQTAGGLTVIIPARNEERNLPLLLADLMAQDVPPDEIIVVDDMSTDATAAAAAAFGIRLICIAEKPDGWTGKAYACQRGADAAAQPLLLFLDADVRLSPAAVSNLLSAYRKTGRVLSVQPYHQTERPYEQLSMFFNLVQVAANGLGLLFSRQHVGLSGPVILFPKADYDCIGGHAGVKGVVTEDVALGQALKAHGIAFDVWLGSSDIAFRMYGHGLKALIQGWTKNFAAGAMQSPAALLLAVALWVSSCMSAPYHLVLAIGGPYTPVIWFYAVLYLLWAAALRLLTRPVGRFSVWAVVLYPVPLTVFIAVFLVSLFRKLLGLQVTWKDRKIKLRN
jgi:4,4'-diaponeurosporenoate glycosyltransferase